MLLINSTNLNKFYILLNILKFLHYLGRCWLYSTQPKMYAMDFSASCILVLQLITQMPSGWHINSNTMYDMAKTTPTFTTYSWLKNHSSEQNAAWILMMPKWGIWYLPPGADYWRERWLKLTRKYASSKNPSGKITKFSFFVSILEAGFCCCDGMQSKFE